MSRLVAAGAFGVTPRLPDGEVPIEEIRAGDRVWAYDETTGEVGLCDVVRTFARDAESIVEIVLTTQDGPDADCEPDVVTVRATDEHPFWVIGNGWRAANALKAGDKVRTLPEDDDDARIEHVTVFPGVTTVYNLEVEGSHTYFVSYEQLLVHNSCRPPISIQKQAGHVPGTPQYANRAKQGKATSSFFGKKSGDKATQIAYERGTPLPNRPNTREYNFGVGIGTGPNGGIQTRVRVHIDGRGRIHGHPVGQEL